MTFKIVDEKIVYDDIFNSKPKYNITLVWASNTFCIGYSGEKIYFAIDIDGAVYINIDENEFVYFYNRLRLMASNDTICVEISKPNVWNGKTIYFRKYINNNVKVQIRSCLGWSSAIVDYNDLLKACVTLANILYIDIER